MHIDSWSPRKRSHILKIELNSRYEYIFNPGSEDYEQVLINDFVEHEYADYETAEVYRNEWQGYWQEYLDSQK